MVFMQTVKAGIEMHWFYEIAVIVTINLVCFIIVYDLYRYGFLDWLMRDKRT